LAWLLQRSTVILPIPGTSRLKHLQENAAAGVIILSDHEFTQLDRATAQRRQG
jgi:pyridoxine 4-dehydrogenase